MFVNICFCKNTSVDSTDMFIHQLPFDICVHSRYLSHPKTDGLTTLIHFMVVIFRMAVVHTALHVIVISVLFKSTCICSTDSFFLSRIGQDVPGKARGSQGELGRARGEPK